MASFENAMSLDALRETLPAYAKDLSLNLSSLANETVLSDQQKWGTFVASAYAIGTPAVIKAVDDAVLALQPTVKLGAVLVFAPEAAFTLERGGEAQTEYLFNTGKIHHLFCKTCGIYPFHQTMRKPGHYRLNLGCVEELDATRLPFEVFDGASI